MTLPRCPECESSAKIEEWEYDNSSSWRVICSDGLCPIATSFLSSYSRAIEEWSKLRKKKKSERLHRTLSCPRCRKPPILRVDGENIWLECCSLGVVSTTGLDDAIEEWNKKLMYYGSNRYSIDSVFLLNEDLALMKERLGIE